MKLFASRGDKLAKSWTNFSNRLNQTKERIEKSSPRGDINRSSVERLLRANEAQIAFTQPCAASQ